MVTKSDDIGSVPAVKDLYTVEFKYGAVFTGGRVEMLSDGATLVCQSTAAITIQKIANGQIVSTLGPRQNEVEDPITSFAIGSDEKTIVTSHKSSLFKLWDIDNCYRLLQHWRSSHHGPVPKLALRGTLLASGGIDSRVRLWEISKKQCLHNLQGLSGVTSILEFRPQQPGQTDTVFAAADDTVIQSWDVASGEKLTSYKGHFSKITGLVFARDGIHMVSASRDRVMILWDIASGVAKRTVPAYETIEGLVMLPASFKLPTSDKVIDTGINVAIAGTNGVVRVWNMLAARELYVQQNSQVPKAAEGGGLAIMQLIFNEATGMLAVVAADHNIFFHRLDTFEFTKVVVGYLDEILDIVLLGRGETHIAVASNGPDVKLYRRSDMNCQLLRGHTDIVLSLASTVADPNMLVSSSKDNSVRLWCLDPDTNTVSCLAVGTGHSGSVGAVAFANGIAGRFASGSQDTCLKLWAWDAGKGLRATHTVIAHKKDINAVAFSPNDKLIATASEDHTAKLWSGAKLKPIGVLRGHKRTVWSIAFSALKSEVVTASADCSVRIWQLSDLTCLKSLEDDQTGLLRCSFLSGGHQVIASGVDGILRMWDLSGEKIVKMDLHNSRVWALAVSLDESRIITGDSGSMLAVWKDTTVEKRMERIEKANHLAEQEQLLANLLNANKLLAGLKLALTLNRPLQVLKICKQVLKVGGESHLRNYIGKLRKDQKKSLLTVATTWNTNSKNVYVAQSVLNMLLNWLSVAPLELVPKTIEDLIPYTDRHFQRLTKLMQDVHMLEYMATLGGPTVKGFE